MQEDTKTLYITGLKNARAVETQAVEMLTRQVERLENYPELEQGLRRHVAESEQQRDRLDGILEAHGESASTIKEMVTGFMGNVAAVVHAPMGDEVLKNALANHAYEHYEIGAYNSLLVLAEMVGDTAAIPKLRESLAEEERMAQWAGEQIGPLTRKFAGREAVGAKAGV